MKIQAKTKIILILVGFLIFTVCMFWFGYSIIGNKNKAASDSIATRRVELEVLQREQKSFEQGKIDLSELAKSAFPPDELFSRDTKVVKEIQQMESIAQKYSLDMTLEVNGNVTTAIKVPGTAGELYAIPYNVTLVGAFSNALLFMQAAERLPFITHAKDVSVIVGAADKSNTIITSEFYLKK